MSALGFTAAACTLAKSIWHTRQRAYDLALLHWDDVDVQTRHLYVIQAADILRANAPICERPAPTPLFDAFVAAARLEFHVVNK